MREISSVNWQLREAKAVLEYMKDVSASTGKSRKVNQLIFGYTFDPADYSTELSEREIYTKAATELATKGLIYGDALNNCGCSTKMLSAHEMLDLIRRHDKVDNYSAEISKIERQLSSSDAKGYQSAHNVNSNGNVNADMAASYRNRATALRGEASVATSAGTEKVNRVNTINSQISQTKHNLNSARAEVKTRQATERDYAQIDKAAGGKGTVYSSVGQMRTIQNIDAINKRNLNYKNFDTGDNLNLLSPTEKATYYRERAAHTMASNALSVAGVAVNTGIKAGAGVALIAGGQDAQNFINQVDEKVVAPLEKIAPDHINPTLADGAVGGYKALEKGYKGIKNGIQNNRSTTNARTNRPTTGEKRRFKDSSSSASSDIVSEQHNMARIGREGQNKK